MTALTAAVPPVAVVYPDTDGEPMAENTIQYQWIVTLCGNLDAFLPDAFVAGDLFWYPVEGDPLTVIAPDVMVALGRPKGHRKSYMQWEEANVPPKVVFEIWSPSNTFAAQYKKIKFYDRFGVEEFYTWNPESREFSAFIRRNGSLEPVSTEGGFESELLGIRFEAKDDLTVFYKDGSSFLTFAETIARSQAVAQERDAVAQERDAVAQERDAVAQKYDQAAARAELLAAKLRELGIDPSQL